MGSGPSKTSRIQRQEFIRASEPLRLQLQAPVECEVNAYQAQTVDELLGQIAVMLELDEEFGKRLELEFSDEVETDREATLFAIGMREGAMCRVLAQEGEIEAAMARKALCSAWNSQRHQEAVDTLIGMLLGLNPETVEASLRKRLYFNDDGTLQGWHLNDCKLIMLPEEFGTVRTTGNLSLASNELASLPETFGSIRVGGYVYLQGNQIASLPESFRNITVEGNLWLKVMGKNMGPAHETAAAMVFPNVQGKVHL